MKLVNENELKKLHSKLKKIPLKLTLTLCGLFIMCPEFMTNLPLMFMAASLFYSLVSLIFWGIGTTENSLIGIMLGCTLLVAGFTFTFKTCEINAILNFFSTIILEGILFGGIAVDVIHGARYFWLKKRLDKVEY